MKSAEIKESILKIVSELSLHQQIKLLEFIKSIQIDKSKEKKSNALASFAGIFDDEDLKEIKQAIKNCQQIDEDEW